MIKRVVIAVILLSAALGAAAQAVPFITLRTSTDQLAMGGVSAAWGDEFNRGDNVFEAGIGKTFWQTSAINYNLTNYSARVWAIPSLAIGLKFTTNSMGAIDLYSENGQPLGNFQPSELCGGLEVTFMPFKSLSIGVAGKFIRSSLTDQNSARTFAADIMGRWKISNYLTAGVAIENLGKEIDYGYGAYPLPTTYKAGVFGSIPIKEKHAIEAAADFGTMPAYSTILASIGAGYIYNRALALRLGAHISTKGEIMPTYASVGAAYMSENFELGGAYLSVANSFSLSLKLKL